MTLVTASANGDLAFEDGSLVTIPGIIPAEGKAAAALRDALLGIWRGQAMTVHRFPQMDRWSRRVALVSGADGDLAESLLARGAAVLDPVRAPAGCVASWRAAEKTARVNRRGVWSEPLTPLIDAAKANPASLGRFIVVQGRVTSVGERPRRVYLNFGPPASGALSVSLQTRLWRDLSQQGMTAQSLKGRRILVRGIPELINGRIILDLTHAAAIELDP